MQLLISAFLLSLAGTGLWLLLARRFGIGQTIRPEGPSNHKGKTGTPTMGGVVLLLLLLLISFFLPLGILGWKLVLLGLGFGLVGLLDDVIKIRRPDNMGLTAGHKFLLQLLLAGSFIYFLLETGYPTAFWGWFYIPLVLLVLTGASNGVNLTDGLDGLVGGTLIIAFAAFTFLAYRVQFNELVYLGVIIIGLLLGFLVFNLHPAKLFMGDAGALAFGAILGGFAIYLQQELLLIVIGGVFVLETLSVILQVASFKLTGRRIFKMAPLHHHFELQGFSEGRVVAGFWVAGALLAVLGLAITYI